MNPPPFDLQPNLVGELLRLRPLTSLDFEALFQAASDPLIWEQNPEPTRYQRPTFARFFQGAINSKGALVAINLATNEIIGSSRFHTLNMENSQVTIGFTFLARPFWGGHYNGEMKKLMLDHAFKYVNAVNFRIGEKNMRSRQAILKIGARLVGPEDKPTLGGQIHCIYQIARERRS
jgi:N-acetyltransferase